MKFGKNQTFTSIVRSGNKWAFKKKKDQQFVLDLPVIIYSHGETIVQRTNKYQVMIEGSINNEHTCTSSK